MPEPDSLLLRQDDERPIAPPVTEDGTGEPPTDSPPGDAAAAHDPAVLMCYAAAYHDMSLWISRSGQWDNIRAHLQTAAVAEQRVIPPAVDVPADWSDSYYRSVCNDAEFAELLRLGVAPTGYYNAVVRFGDQADEHGRIAAAKNLVRRPMLPVETLPQFAALDRALLGRSPLISLATENTRFSAVPEPSILPFLRAIERGEGFQRGRDVAVIVPWLETGGAELGAYWFYRGAEALGFSPVLILTETASVTPFFAEKNLSIVNIPEIFDSQLGIDYRKLPIELKKVALKAVLASLDVSIVHLVHSWVGYNVLGDKELIEDMLAPPRFLVSAFCPHIHTDGRVDGYFRHIPQIDQAVAGYLCDSAWYAQEMRDLYGVEPERTDVVRFPTTLGEPRQERAQAAGPDRVLWASRLDYQKNPGVVFEIARRMPEVQFDVFGRQVLSDVQVDWDKAPPNVAYRGEFFAFGKLPLRDYKLFLYTSLFDGMPNILLEAASHGMPIVSSPVGGIPEFLANGAGAMVAHAHDVDGYVTSLREMLGDRELRGRMVAESRRRIETERSFETFVKVLAGVPLYRDMLAGVAPGGGTRGRRGLTHAA
jgi:glycosyltransferase involved in cell wall biosynthesis